MNISEELRQKRESALIGLIMLAVGILFILYIGTSLVQATKEFQKKYYQIVSVV